MTDPLAGWWVHELLVERRTGGNAYDEATYAPAEPVTGFYRDGTTVVRGTNGDEIVAAGRFAFPSEVAYIPVDSRVTLPALFGGDKVFVVSSAVADAGPLPTPNHQVIGVK